MGRRWYREKVWFGMDATTFLRHLGLYGKHKVMSGPQCFQIGSNQIFIANSRLMNEMAELRTMPLLLLLRELIQMRLTSLKAILALIHPTTGSLLTRYGKKIQNSGSQPGPYQILPPSGRLGSREGGKNMEEEIGGGRTMTKNIDASMWLICEDSVRPEFDRRNLPWGNSSTHCFYALVN